MVIMIAQISLATSLIIVLSAETSVATYPFFIMGQVQAQITVTSLLCKVSVDTITGVGDTPSDIEYDPVNKRMYVVNHYNNTVSVIDTASKDIIGKPIPVGVFPEDIAYDSFNKRMYVTNFIDGTVSVIDTTTRTVNETIPVDSPFGIAYDPVNERMYIPSFGNDSVSVIDTKSNTIMDTIPSVQPGSFPALLSILVIITCTWLCPFFSLLQT